ncbi:MAG: hypothetical protein J0L56_09105 [Chitinophagales bacterium]|nr:hypothetical protein [Chitinophagales bacterium]
MLTKHEECNWFIGKILPEEQQYTLLAKMSLEIFAQIGLENNYSQSIVGDYPRLDSLKQYARYGPPGISWEYFVRRIHSEDEKFYYASEPDVAGDMLYNYVHLFINEALYMSIILKWYEFTMNMSSS